ncbi:MAG: prepilin-type N-terminal cleavage/methylation domain-containing protein [Acidobacteriia bacterium]|nr:prepilin-type N-terminal cleavage/methylation domain-containing protein [Terriglobia bacterium]
METKRSAPRGFSLAEMLVVLAILGLAIAVGIPLVSEQVRLAKVRGVADQLAIDLKAARMIAVSKRVMPSLDFDVFPHPTNRYQYPGTNGLPRSIQLPDGVRITSPSAETHIYFLPNGSLASAATLVLEADVSGGVKEQWTITTSVMGVSSTTHQRVAS